MNRLTVLAGEIKTLRTEANGLYDKMGDDAPSRELVDQIKSVNQKLEDKENEYKELSEIDESRRENDRRLKELDEPLRKGGAYGGRPESKEGGPKAEKKGRERLSDVVMDDPDFKSWMEGNAKRGYSEKAPVSSPMVEVKTLVTGASSTSAGAFVRPDYDADVMLPRRPLTIRDIITVGQTDSDAVSFVRQTSRTNNAAPVAEATATSGSSGTKPESGFALEEATANVKTIPTWIPVTRQALQDAAQIRGLIDDELRYMVEEELETQIVAGDGTGQNFLGLINTPGLSTRAFDTDALTTLRRARTTNRITARAGATAILMSPTDAEALDLETDGSGRYFFGGPSSIGNLRVWGLPVVEHEDVPAGRAFVGDFRVAKLWDRMRTQVYITDSHSDFFIRNILVMLAELRAAFAVKRPAAITDVDLTA